MSLVLKLSVFSALCVFYFSVIPALFLFSSLWLYVPPSFSARVCQTWNCFSESRHGNFTSSTSISEIRSCLQIESKQTAGILAQGTVGHGLYTNCSCVLLCGCINHPLYLGTYETTSPYLKKKKMFSLDIVSVFLLYCRAVWYIEGNEIRSI